MFATIEDASCIARAQSVFEERALKVASRTGQITFGHQGGGKESMVYFIGPLNFWIAFADSDSGSRYWNALGVGNPFKEGSTIIAEINPPKTGINRRVSGAFIEDGTGRVYLAHRGRVGGGRKGIGKKAFMAWYPETTDLVNDGGRRTKMIVIGALGDEKLIENLAAFTNSVSAFKDEVVSGALSQTLAMPIQTLESVKFQSPVLVTAKNINNERTKHLTLSAAGDLAFALIGGASKKGSAYRKNDLFWDEPDYSDVDLVSSSLKVFRKVKEILLQHLYTNRPWRRLAVTTACIAI